MAHRGKEKGSLAKGSAVHVPFEVNGDNVAAFFHSFRAFDRVWYILTLIARNGRCITIGSTGSYKRE